MFRIRMGRWLCLGAVLFLAGCSSRNSCSDARPGFFSRFRMASNTHSSVAPVGECCGRESMGSMGPYVPMTTQPGVVLPAAPLAQPQQQNIPRIDENGNQMPWDGKTSRPGIKTGTELRTTQN